MYLYWYKLGISFLDLSIPAPLSHLLPDINFLPFENSLNVSRHLFSQPLHLVCITVVFNSSISFNFNNVDSAFFSSNLLYLSFAIKATP